jgi:hypothetical protein
VAFAKSFNAETQSNAELGIFFGGFGSKNADSAPQVLLPLPLGEGWGEGCELSMRSGGSASNVSAQPSSALRAPSPRGRRAYAKRRANGVFFGRIGSENGNSAPQVFHNLEPLSPRERGRGVGTTVAMMFERTPTSFPHPACAKFALPEGEGV